MNRLKAWWLRLRQRLSDWLAPDATHSIAVTPGESCDHTVDSAVRTKQLLLASNDPMKLAEALAEFAGCEGCLTATLVYAIYFISGLVMDSEPYQDDNLDPLPCTCKTPKSGEAYAMMLALCRGSEDTFATSMVLQQFLPCPSCTVDTVVALANANVALLDHATIAWRPLLEKNLASLLDEATP